MTSARTIAFDGGIFAETRPGGVLIAFRESLRAFGAAYPDSSRLLIPPGAQVPALPGIDVLETGCVAGPLARQFRLPGLLARLNARLYHSPVAAICGRTSARIIATIHDIPWAHADLPREGGHGIRHRLAFSRAMGRSTAVIVPSEATANDVRRIRPNGIARLRVIYHGVTVPESADLSPHQGPFVTMGDDRPRKNIDHVVRAHALARTRDPSLPALLQIGPRRDRGREQVLDDPAKHALLQRARALVQVSLHEGFGLPVLEAMGHGTPTIVSTRGSLPEIAGDPAIQVDPRDLEALAGALLHLWHDDAAWREHSQLGRERAKHFTPARTAEAWHALHRELESS